MCDVGQKNTESMFYKNLIGQEAGQNNLPFDNFKKLIDDVKAFRPFISVTSTEPLLYPDIISAISYVRKSDLHMNMTTNGYLLERHAKDIVKSGLDRLTVSLDGPPAIHNSIRGLPDAYERVLKGIDAIVEEKKRQGKVSPLINVNCTISNLNVGHLYQFVEALPLNCINQVGFMTMVFCTKNLADKHNEQFGHIYPATETCLSGGIDPAKTDVDLMYHELQKIQSTFNSKVVYYFPLKKKWLKTYFTQPDEFMNSNQCVFPWYAAQITSSGDFIGLTRCYATTFGNLADGKFLDVWNGQKMRKFRKDLGRHKRFTACTRCEGVLYL
jgi:MoaA/NifB/PqqE/SkfB family radical SAM enzyme